MPKTKKHQKTKKKNEKIYKKNSKLVTFGLLVSIVLFVFIIYKILDALIFADKSYDLSGSSYYQYFYGIREEYSGNMEAVITDKGIKLTLENEQMIYLDSTPIYYTDTLGKALFAEKMEIIIPDEGSYRIDNFTNVFEENKIMYLKKYNKNKTVAIENGFLFDGSDLYFFLDDMTIIVGDQEYEVSALSYAIVEYRDNVEIYDYENDNYIIIQDETQLEADVLAVNKPKNYTINMSVDSLSTTQSETLLITNISNLEEFEIK